MLLAEIFPVFAFFFFFLKEGKIILDGLSGEVIWRDELERGKVKMVRSNAGLIMSCTLHFSLSFSEPTPNGRASLLGVYPMGSHKAPLRRAPTLTDLLSLSGNSSCLNEGLHTFILP